MAMTDYFYECNKLETKTVADGLGGYETIEYVGIAFKGLAVKRGSQEQLIGALRGRENVQYVFHTFANVPLVKDDKIMYNEKGVDKFIRLTSNAEINTDKSKQTNWKSYQAESYVPTDVKYE